MSFAYLLGRTAAILGRGHSNQAVLMVMANPGELPTALDVIENSLGSKPRTAQLEALTVPELEVLAGSLAELSTAQSADEIPGGASLVGGWLGAHWSEPNLRSELSNALLFYQTLLVLDPLADFFDDRSSLPPTRSLRVSRPEDNQFNVISSGPALWSSQGNFRALLEQPDVAAKRFAAIVDNLYTLEPLIRSGVVVLRNQWPILARNANALATSVRHDIKTPELQALAREPADAENAFQVWDNMRGLNLDFGDGAIHSSDGPWQTQHIFYYLAKTLAVADASGAQYVPSTERDLELLRRKGATATRSSHSAEFLQEVSRVVVPSIDVPIREAVAMRRDSEGFEEWRKHLSILRRDGASDDPEALRERVEYELGSAVREIESEVAGSSLLGSIGKLSADVIISAGIGAGAAALSGGSAALAIGSAVTTGVVQWVRDAYGRKGAGGEAAVLAALVKGSRRPAKGKNAR